MSRDDRSMYLKKLSEIRANERLLDAGRVATKEGCMPEIRKCGSTLEEWFAENARPFVWRSGVPPFVLLVAEILLRKTGALAVNALLPELLAEYENPSSLANADVRHLQLRLQNIGLSRQRAVQLRELGIVLELQFQGSVPLGVRDLLQLPGIGAYSAASVASATTGLRVPAVDSNVARVILRVFGESPSNLEARKSPNIWRRAGQMLACWEGKSSEFNWALLDLAALVCRPQRPACDKCPLRDCCAFAGG
jgi:A/G-specific adenine glycosylase